MLIFIVDIQCQIVVIINFMLIGLVKFNNNYVWAVYILVFFYGSGKALSEWVSSAYWVLEEALLLLSRCPPFIYVDVEARQDPVKYRFIWAPFWSVSFSRGGGVQNEQKKKKKKTMSGSVLLIICSISSLLNKYLGDILG